MDEADLVEKRFKRMTFESILLIREGNRVTSILGKGLEHRKDEWDFVSEDLASDYFDECLVKIMVDGFVEVG